ncbi:hypothetical protein [Brasilonema sennae]|nr:hypothetical protein [Brasilonema sennae]
MVRVSLLKNLLNYTRTSRYSATIVQIFTANGDAGEGATIGDR